MEIKARVEKGSALIRTVFFSVLGLLFVALGMSFLPVIGIVVGAAFLWFALYPWLSGLHLNKVKVLISSMSDNYLEQRRISVAILSATKQRDGFEFDPRRVDPKTVQLGPERVLPLDDMSDPAVYGRSLVDINEDGIPDLVLYFSGDSAGISEKVEEICVRAKTWGGERVLGCNSIEFGYESGLLSKLQYA